MCVGVKKLQFRYIVMLSASHQLKCSLSVSRGNLRFSFWKFLLDSGVYSASSATRYMENPLRKVKCDASFKAPTARIFQTASFADLSEILWKFDRYLQSN